jgi:hypothetical protein
LAQWAQNSPSFLSHLFFDRRNAPMLVLGFASGMQFTNLDQRPSPRLDAAPSS